MANIRKSDITPGLLVRSTSHSDVLVRSDVNRDGMVTVEQFDYRGEPYTTNVHYSTLRW